MLWDVCCVTTLRLTGENTCFERMNVIHNTLTTLTVCSGEAKQRKADKSCRPRQLTNGLNELSNENWSTKKMLSSSNYTCKLLSWLAFLPVLDIPNVLVSAKHVTLRL